MKRRVAPLVALAASLVLVGAGMAWAGTESHSVKVTLDSAVMLGGQTLPAGNYTFSWMGNGPQVNVAVKEHGRVIEQTKAQIVEKARRAASESLLTRTEKKGAPYLEEVRLRGERTAIDFKAA
jgi:hypothetical protein